MRKMGDTPETILDFAKTLRDTKVEEIPTHMVSGNGTTHKCQLGWFTSVSGLCQLVMEQGHFDRNWEPEPPELGEFVETYAIRHKYPIDDKDVKAGNRVLTIIIEAMERFSCN